MPKLTREDWKKLRDKYKVAFKSLSPADFENLLDNAYSAVNPGAATVDYTDALMIGHIRAEPPIQPAAEDPIA